MVGELAVEAMLRLHTLLILCACDKLTEMGVCIDDVEVLIISCTMNPSLSMSKRRANGKKPESELCAITQ